MTQVTFTINLNATDELTREVAEEVRQHLIRTYADILPTDPVVALDLPSWAPENPTETADYPPVDEFAGEWPRPIDEEERHG
jgi:hypothetical protein